jgi:amidase
MVDDSALFDDATAQAAALRDGRVSAVELTTAMLDRIDAVDDVLRSYVTVDREGALTQARAADKRLRADRKHGGDLPPFLGVTLSIKDVEDVAGLPTTHSCRALADHRAAADSPIVRRFREAGFVILGKTNVPEFCTTMTTSDLNGVCRNPWDLDRTPGGSSGGAAAALAAGLCAASHGTDGAGSVRGPAAFCGLVGIKPSRGLIDFGSEEGPAYFGTTVNGVLTRTVRDTAALLDVMTGNRGGTEIPEQADGPLRIAVTATPPMGVIEPECGAAAEAVGEVLSSLGHHVDMATPDWNAIMAAALGPMEVPGAAALIDPSQFDLVEPRNRPMVEGLAALTVVEHARWVEQVRAAARTFLQFWEQFDVLVSPTAGVVAPPLTWAPWDQNPDEHMMTFAAFPSFAQPFNLSGQPAISLPLAWSTSGLPIGIQLAGRPRDEATLLRLSYQLESALPWSERTPLAYRRMDAI